MTTRTTAEAWLAGRLPQDWFTGPVEVSSDRDELIVWGGLGAPDLAADADDAERELAARARRQVLP